MKIALLTTQWPGARMGGIGAAVREQAQALAAVGHAVHVFLPELPAEVRAVLPADVTFHETAGPADGVQAAAAGIGGYRLAVAARLAEAVLAEHAVGRFDVVEAPDVEGLALPLLLHAAFAVPVVVQLHCCTAIADRAHDNAGEALVHALEHAAIALADGVCAPTARVVELTREFVDFDGATILPHAFGVAQDCGEPPRDGPILFVGRIERLKGVVELAEALNIFLPRNPGARFRFVGPDTPTAPGGGSMRQWIVDRIEASVAARVEFAGELPPDQVARELRAALFVVQPSLYENFSIALCQAMAAGRPAIVASGTGSVEVVGDGGVVLAAGDARALAAAMERLYRDREALLNLSDRARERIATLCDPMRVAAARALFYQEVIARGRRRRDVGTLDARLLGPLLPACLHFAAAAAGADALRWVTPGHRLLRIMRQLNAPAVALYGAGKHTDRLLAERQLWEAHGHRVATLIDDHPRFRSAPLHAGLPVVALAEYDAEFPVVLSTDTYEEQFWRQQTQALRERGIRVVSLYRASSGMAA